MASTSDKALSILVKSAPGSALLPKLPKQLTSELALIHKLESQAAGRAIRVGLWLWQAKEVLKHGEFKPWIEKNVEGKSYRSCAYYMKLAMTFVEKTRVSGESLHALVNHNFKNAPKSKDAKAAVDALTGFVGELSLSELLIKHGIKSVGLKAALTGGDDGAGGAPADPQMELTLLWDQAYTPAKSLADLLSEKAAALKPDQRAALEAELKRALDYVRAV